jgi:uncharacterized membrane protein
MKEKIKKWIIKYPHKMASILGIIICLMTLIALLVFSSFIDMNAPLTLPIFLIIAGIVAVAIVLIYLSDKAMKKFAEKHRNKEEKNAK